MISTEARIHVIIYNDIIVVYFTFIFFVFNLLITQRVNALMLKMKKKNTLETNYKFLS